MGLFNVAFILWGFFFRTSLVLAENRPYVPRAEGGDHPFDWNSITPSEKIVWRDCSEVHKCARLLLPLDYQTPNGPKATIALRMLPAPNGPYGKNSSSYKGPIFINPGGPGGSGTRATEQLGNAISTVVGPDFDVLGFDPRGTGSSYPTATCFDGPAQYGVWGVSDTGLIKPGDGSIATALARNTVVKERCLKALGGTGGDLPDGSVEDWGIGRFMSTSSVVTDMLRMSELLGQEKLHYWGFSYGTVIGQYLAAMYPDKLGRVVLDGIVDAEANRSNTWGNIKNDIEIIFDTFFTLCSQAGAAKCPLYSPNPIDIRNRVYAIIEKLEKSPIPIPFAKTGPALLTSGLLRKTMFQSTYIPPLAFPGLARDLLAIENNDQTVLAAYIDEMAGFACDCQNPGLSAPLLGAQALAAVSCGDGDAFTESEADLKNSMEAKSKISPLFAPVILSIRLQCNGWPIRPKSRYTGPFSLPSNISLSSTSPTQKTSPILLISTRYDPISTLADAESVHNRLGAGNSRLIVQESAGHCAITAPSACTMLRVRAYFQEGKVPAEGEDVKCQARVLPFVGLVKDATGEVDKELEAALTKFSETIL